MDQHPSLTEAFFHLRLLIGTVTGLALGRLLTGFARFVQHPSHARIYLPHLLWAVFMLLAVLNIWWSDLSLRWIETWTFPLYAFLIGYTALYFFLCTWLFPDSLAEWGSYEAFFLARRRWFFGLLAVMLMADLGDTAVKGAAYFAHLGWVYPLRQVGLTLLCIAAMATPNRSFHLAFAVLAVAQEVLWIWQRYSLLT